MTKQKEVGELSVDSMSLIGAESLPAESPTVKPRVVHGNAYLIAKKLEQVQEPALSCSDQNSIESIVMISD